MLFDKVANVYEADSLANRLRRKRLTFFMGLLDSVPPPVRILDVGGTVSFWQMMGFSGRDDMDITLLNTTREPVNLPHFSSVVGDARRMDCFRDREFDVVFCNSVIEHLGTMDDMRRMAREIRRVGLRYFVQTPNRYFPIEPHFFFPGFQFLPLSAQIWLITHFNLGAFAHANEYPYDVVKKAIQDIRLLSRKEFMRLFPEANLYRERFAGLTVSLIAYYGWEGETGR